MKYKYTRILQKKEIAKNTKNKIHNMTKTQQSKSQKTRNITNKIQLNMRITKKQKS